MQNTPLKGIMPGMPETLAQMARQRVLEGEERIAQQKLMVAQLYRNGHLVAWQQASKFLLKLEDFQATAEDHLSRAIKLQEASGPMKIIWPESAIINPFSVRDVPVAACTEFVDIGPDKVRLQTRDNHLPVRLKTEAVVTISTWAVMRCGAGDGDNHQQLG